MLEQNEPKPHQNPGRSHLPAPTESPGTNPKQNWEQKYWTLQEVHAPDRLCVLVSALVDQAPKLAHHVSFLAGQFLSEHGYMGVKSFLVIHNISNYRKHVFGKLLDHAAEQVPTANVTMSEAQSKPCTAQRGTERNLAK